MWLIWGSRWCFILLKHATFQMHFLFILSKSKDWFILMQQTWVTELCSIKKYCHYLETATNVKHFSRSLLWKQDLAHSDSQIFLPTCIRFWNNTFSDRKEKENWILWQKCIPKLKFLFKLFIIVNQYIRNLNAGWMHIFFLFSRKMLCIWIL